MSIYTTYFANLKNLDRMTSCPIAICGKAPDSYHGLQYKKLAPTYAIFKEYKESRNENRYEWRFHEEVLALLCIDVVLEDFRNMINNTYNMTIPQIENWWEHIPFDIYLVCYEKPEDFCHRHLVANWFGEYYIKVKER